MNDSTQSRPPRRARLALAAIALAVPFTAARGLIIEDRPIALISPNITMEKGVACVPLADLAKALGGTLQVNLEKRLIVVTAGPNGLLKVNAGPLANFAQASKLRRASPGQQGLSRSQVAQGQAASQNAAVLRLGGADVMFEEFEVFLLRPNPLMPLSLLGELLGGKARLDAKTNAWVLPHGGPGSPLAFR